MVRKYIYMGVQPNMVRGIGYAEWYGWLRMDTMVGLEWVEDGSVEVQGISNPDCNTLLDANPPRLNP